MDRRTCLRALGALGAAGALPGCATESRRPIEPVAVAAARTPWTGPRRTIVVAGFANRSDYGRGVFSDGTDRLGGQARTILKTHLQATGRFDLVERDGDDGLAREAAIAGVDRRLDGAEIAVGGDVTEFGRKVTGDRQLFGVLGAGKVQSAYAKVSLNLVDVATSRVVHAVQGAGEYALSNREVAGFGGTAGYDATLNGKVLDFAIAEAVDRLVLDLEAGALAPRAG